MVKKSIIHCPNCNAEYLPAEIYIPNSFMGKPSKVLRFNDGSIDDFFGKDMDLNEQYTCDFCDTKFYVKAFVKFNTFMNKQEDFSQETTTKLHKAKLFLSEE